MNRASLCELLREKTGIRLWSFISHMVHLNFSVLGLKIGASEQIYDCLGHVSNYKLTNKPYLMGSRSLVS